MENYHHEGHEEHEEENGRKRFATFALLQHRAYTVEPVLQLNLSLHDVACKKNLMMACFE